MSAVPKLRFPEFEGDWEDCSLRSIVSMKSGKFIRAAEILEESDNGTYPCYGGNGLRGYVRTHNHNGKYVLIGRQGALCGNVLLVNGAFYATEHAVVTEARSGNDISWLQFQLDRMNLNQYSTGLAQPGLSVSNLNELRCLTPSLFEQQKIASFLTSVDKKIDLLRQKKDALELYKKGLMQKIFSQEIRFKQDGGSDFPDWEEVTVGDMAERHVRGLTSSTLNFFEKGYPVYGASGVIGYIDNYLSEQRYIGVVKDGAGVGRVFEAVEQSSLLSTMESIIPKSGFSFGFVKQVIKDIDFKKFTTGSTIPHVYFKDYSKESYPCPAYEEQERIAHLLDLFDAKIQKTSSQIEQMETFKKGLLQQMFV